MMTQPSPLPPNPFHAPLPAGPCDAVLATWAPPMPSVSLNLCEPSGGRDRCCAPLRTWALPRPLERTGAHEWGCRGEGMGLIDFTRGAAGSAHSSRPPTQVLARRENKGMRFFSQSFNLALSYHLFTDIFIRKQREFSSLNAPSMARVIAYDLCHLLLSC